MNKVYKIKAVKNPKIDAEYDAYCNDFEGKEMIGINMMGTRHFNAPSILYFTADFSSIPLSDFPFIDLSFPVFSVRMFEILKSVRGFDHHAIPVTMLDDSYLENQFDKNGYLKSNLPRDSNYLAVQFKDFEDVFDYESSKYQKDLVFPEDVGVIEKLTLKTPKDGFNSMFKIKEAMEYVFVSEKAKQALELNNVKGCVFEEVETTPSRCSL